MALEQLAATAHTLLDKECRTAWHLDFDQNGHYNEHWPQEKETEERDDTVKKVFYQQLEMHFSEKLL